MGTVSLAIDAGGSTLHAAWTSKNSTNPNSFNLRYAKGVINGDGTTSWTGVSQLTALNTSGMDNLTPSIVVKGDGNPSIFSASTVSNDPGLHVTHFNGSSWTGINGGRGVIIHSGGSLTYPQLSPSALFVPQAVNNLANGRFWVAWHGRDAADPNYFNIFVSSSDDGGATWAVPTKLSSANSYDRKNVTLGADKTGKVFALYEQHEWEPDTDIYKRTYNGSWGSESQVTSQTNPDEHPSALVDFGLTMTLAPFVYTESGQGINFTGDFYVGAAVSPASGSLGNKETRTLASYTVTPEDGTTITQIVEKLNGTTVSTYTNPASLSRSFALPQVTWDALAYYDTHTISVVVTDSNGVAVTTSYTFVKTLAASASLLEATKANADAKNRIEEKREALAAQVGLLAGASFDAIHDQLDSEAFSKVATGTVNRSSSTLTFTHAGGSQSSTWYISVSGLAFKPRVIIAIGNTSRQFSMYSEINDSFKDKTVKMVRFGSGTGTYDVTNFDASIEPIVVDETSFLIPANDAETYTWIAFS